MVALRAMWNYDRDAASLEAGLEFDPDVEVVYDDENGKKRIEYPGRSVAQQQFAKECDINEIVRRFGLTGQMPTVLKLPQSGDFTGVSDFKSALDAVIAAQEGFMELPADVRDRFRNDPQRLLEFMADEKNRDEAIKLGLVSAPVERPRDAVMAIDDLAAHLKGATSAKP